MLLMFADCHFHFEVVFTSAVFMYLYKYLHKGPDWAFYGINHNNDVTPINEANDYQKGRYLSAFEADWRISSFEISHKFPSVICLPVHLPNKNFHQFHRSNDAPSTVSLLDRYFLRPLHLRDVTYEAYNADYLLYPYNGEQLRPHEALEQPRNGVIRRKVAARQNGMKVTVTRITTVPISSGELFYIRLLLLHRPALSWEDLRTFDGITLDTYHQAALHAGLIENNNEGFLALEEAVQSLNTPAQLRFLFSRILLEGYPALPLYDHFRDALMLDFLDRTQDPALAEQLLLQDLSQSLADGGRRLSNFGLREPNRRDIEVDQELAFFRPQVNILAAHVDDMTHSMTEEQREIFHGVLSQVRNKERCFYFIEGRPGRGKTYLLNAIAGALRSQHKIVLTVATSAIAASQYPRARTAHALFGIPVTNVSISSPFFPLPFPDCSYVFAGVW